MGRVGVWLHMKRIIASSSNSLSSPPVQFYLSSPPRPHLAGPISQLSRFFSTNLAISEPYDHGFIGGHQDGNHRLGLEPPEEEEIVRYIPVKAYFLSTSIDLKSIQADNSSDVIPATSRSSNYVALRYSDMHPGTTDTGVKENMNSYRYVVAFQYGSAVLFNIADHEAEQYLDMIRKHATGLLPEMRKDDYWVIYKHSFELMSADFL